MSELKLNEYDKQVLELNNKCSTLFYLVTDQVKKIKEMEDVCGVVGKKDSFLHDKAYNALEEYQLVLNSLCEDYTDAVNNYDAYLDANRDKLTGTANYEHTWKEDPLWVIRSGLYYIRFTK